MRRPSVMGAYRVDFAEHAFATESLPSDEKLEQGPQHFLIRLGAQPLITPRYRHLPLNSCNQVAADIRYIPLQTQPPATALCRRLACVEKLQSS